MTWRVEEGAFGPRTARLFQIALAINALFAWFSLSAQVEILIGSRGLLPIAPFVDALSSRATDSGSPLGYFDYPTLFWWGASGARRPTHVRKLAAETATLRRWVGQVVTVAV